MSPYVIPGLIRYDPVEEVIQAACKACGIKRSQISQVSRKTKIKTARFLFIEYANKRLKLSTVRIGEILNQTHGNIIAAIKRVETLRQSMDEQFAEFENNFRCILMGDFLPIKKNNKIKKYINTKTGVKYNTTTDLSISLGYKSKMSIKYLLKYQKENFEILLTQL